MGAAALAPGHPAVPPVCAGGCLRRDAQRAAHGPGAAAPGFDDVAVRATDRDGTTLQRVLVGPVRDAPQLDDLVARLQDAGYDDARLAID